VTGAERADVEYPVAHLFKKELSVLASRRYRRHDGERAVDRLRHRARHRRIDQLDARAASTVPSARVAAGSDELMSTTTVPLSRAGSASSTALRTASPSGSMVI